MWASWGLSRALFASAPIAASRARGARQRLSALASLRLPVHGHVPRIGLGITLRKKREDFFVVRFAAAARMGWHRASSRSGGEDGPTRGRARVVADGESRRHRVRGPGHTRARCLRLERILPSLAVGEIDSRCRLTPLFAPWKVSGPAPLPLTEPAGIVTISMSMTRAQAIHIQRSE